jgi:chemotaxis protein CheD
MSVERLFLKPGEVMMAGIPTIITTVLGSCVSITMFSERCSIGGICHAMLPRNPPFRSMEKLRYVDTSIRHMLHEFEALGIGKDEIETKVLGGADVLERVSGSSASVGQQNIRAALKIIRGEGLRIAASDVGGELGRKIHFYTHTGEVLLKRIDRRPVEVLGCSATEARIHLDQAAKRLRLAYVRAGCGWSER